jgi:hypothetical protein
MFTTTNAIEQIKEFSLEKAKSTNQVGTQRSTRKTARDIAIGKLGEFLVAEKYGGEVDLDIYTYGAVDSGWDILIDNKKISIKKTKQNTKPPPKKHPKKQMNQQKKNQTKRH